MSDFMTMAQVRAIVADELDEPIECIEDELVEDYAEEFGIILTDNMTDCDEEM
jgi:hypothetical protein